MWSEYQRKWPSEERPSVDRSDDPPGSWRGEGNRYLEPAANAQVEEAYGAICKAPRDLPTIYEPTRGASDRVDQSDLAGMGALLCSGALKPVLRVRQRLGREEDSTAPDAIPETSRIRLAKVE